MHENSKLPQKFELPTIIVVFGITGDLVKRKILKALYHLFIKKLLPKKFIVYGFSRRSYSDVELHQYLKEIIVKNSFPYPDRYDQFLSAFHYVQGNFNEVVAYKNLAKLLGRVDGQWNVCSNKLFYLAVPPESYSHIIHNLHDQGLTIPCSPKEGWTRVILEKPFGTDLVTAKKLDLQLGKLFKEEQLYRVDHYLAKETVRNILAFRFGNTFLQPAWNNKWIEKIEVKLLEKNTVSARGDFYDRVGALRDVGQNHLLQLLALFIMDEPSRFTPSEIKKKRSLALDSLLCLTNEQIDNSTSRAQYDGYLKEKGVDKNSTTETYFKIQVSTRNRNFLGVPMYIESGKAMSQDLTEVIITFKHPISSLYKDKKISQNVLHYYLRPFEKISMRFLAKKPGFEFKMEEHELGFDYHEVYAKDAFIDDYEALLYDIIKGDQTLFVSTEEIITQWQFIEPIIKRWNQRKDTLLFYKPK